MNEKRKNHYEWAEKRPLTKRIVDYVRQAGEDAELDHISQMVMDDMIAKIEVTNATAPFTVFCLRDLARTIEGMLDEDGASVLRDLEAVMRPVSVAMKVPFTLGAQGDESEREKK